MNIRIYFWFRHHQLGEVKKLQIWNLSCLGRWYFMSYFLSWPKTALSLTYQILMCWLKPNETNPAIALLPCWLSTGGHIQSHTCVLNSLFLEATIYFKLSFSTSTYGLCHSSLPVPCGNEGNSENRSQQYRRFQLIYKGFCSQLYAIGTIGFHTFTPHQHVKNTFYRSRNLARLPGIWEANYSCSHPLSGQMKLFIALWETRKLEGQESPLKNSTAPSAFLPLLPYLYTLIKSSLDPTRIWHDYLFSGFLELAYK